MIEQITQENFEEKTKDPCVVDFYADWCGPCRMLSPILESISVEMKDKKFFKLDIDENPSISEKFNVKAIPTILVFKDGEVVKRILGYKHQKTLLEELQN